MARSIKTISSFNAGEVSPLVRYRVDLAKYNSSCISLLNSIASKYGPAMRRPGTQFVSLPSSCSSLEWSNWVTAVTNAGGTFSPVSKMLACLLIRAIDSRPYGSKIKYLLPLLGTNLAAALVPLRDTLGIGLPTNFNFVNADFAEAHGLQGDGTSKFLQLNMTPFGINPGPNSGGLGYWENKISFTGSAVEPIGSYHSMAAILEARFVLDLRSASSSFSWAQPPNSATVASASVNAHYYGQSTSSSSRQLFINGVSVASNTTTDAQQTGDQPIEVMGCDEIDAGGHHQRYWAGRCAVAYVTDGTLAPTDAVDFHTLLQSYLISPLGR